MIDSSPKDIHIPLWNQRQCVNHSCDCNGEVQDKKKLKEGNASFGSWFEGSVMAGKAWQLVGSSVVVQECGVGHTMTRGREQGGAGAGSRSSL